MKTYKVKLKLNNKQRTRLFRNASASRFAYNLTLELQEENYKKGNKFVKTNNIKKLETSIQKKRIKQQDIKKDYFHKSTTALVRTKPKAIVLEDLNVAGMRKNKYLSHSLQETSISTFKQMLINKAESHGIEVVLADRFYPSSQICSHCGNRKVDLKLSERVYKCPICGLEIDRDLNASINLKHYREFPEKLSLWRAKTTGVVKNNETEFYEEGILHKADNCSVQLETFIS